MLSVCSEASSKSFVSPKDVTKVHDVEMEFEHRVNPKKLEMTDYDEDLNIAHDSPIERSQTIPPPRRLVTLQRAWFPLDAGHDWSNPLMISVELGDCEPQFSSAKRVFSNEGATIGTIEYNEPFSFTVDMGDEDFDSSSLQIEVYDETDPQNELGCASVRCHPCLKATYADIYDYNGNELCRFLVAFS